MRDVTNDDSIIIRFMDSVKAGTATLEESDQTYLGLVFEDCDYTIFIPIRRNPTEEDEKEFVSDFIALDQKWSNIGEIQKNE